MLTQQAAYFTTKLCLLPSTQTAAAPPGEHPVRIRGHVSMLTLASVHHKGVFNLLVKYKAAVDDAVSDCLSQSSWGERLLLFPSKLLLQESHQTTATTSPFLSYFLPRLIYLCLNGSFSNTKTICDFRLNYQKVSSGNLIRIGKFYILCAFSESLHPMFARGDANPFLPPHTRTWQLLNSRVFWSGVSWSSTNDTHSHPHIQQARTGHRKTVVLSL